MTDRAMIRRVSDQAVTLTYTDEMGDRITREFWVPPSGGYVREVTDARPGTLGRQVCNGLDHMGSTLDSSPEGLLDLIRAEWKAAKAAERRARARW